MRRGLVPGAVMAALIIAGVLVMVLRPAPGPEHPSDRVPRPLQPALDVGDGALRMTAFGTSLTAGDAWPDRLATVLAACSGRRVSVARVAAPGADSAWALERVDLVAAQRPHLVLVEFAINDADLLDGVSLARSRTRHDALLDALAREIPDARIMLMTTSPVQGIVRRLQRPRLPAYYAMYRALADARGTALADLAPRWRAAAGELPRHPDGLHPAPEAARAVIVPALAGLIGAALSAPECRGLDR